MAPTPRSAAFALAVLAALAGCAERPGAPARPLNVVLVVADALRRDHLSCYGYRRQTTPHLDAFAADALLFENAFAQSPSTKPSVASLFTSLYPSQHGILRNADALPGSHASLAEVLRDHGYATAAFVENPVLHEQFGFRQGFDTWHLDPRRDADHRTSERMDALDAERAAWLRLHREGPFFLYVHFIDPHNPYTAPDAYQGLFHAGSHASDLELRVGARLGDGSLPEALARYDEEIRYIDDRFGALLDQLRELGVLDTSFVAFLSDHGEAFMEHGLVFHSSSVYGELINIPLIARLPGAFPAGRTSEPATHVDLFPTLLELAGIPPGELALEGTSLLQRLGRAERGEGEPVILSEHLRPGWGTLQRAAIKGRWKLVHHLETDRYELFDTRRDPTDVNDLLAGADDRLAQLLKAELSSRLALLRPGVAPEQAELGPELRTRLEALGYVEQARPPGRARSEPQASEAHQDRGPQATRGAAR